MSDVLGTIAQVKLLHTSDWHVGRPIRGRSRADEHRAVLAEVAGIAADQAVDLVLVAGDLFDSAAPTPESESIVYDALLQLAQVAPVVVIAGNHDNPRRLRAVAPLLELGRITVGATLARPMDGGVVKSIPGVEIALLPFTSQRGIVRAHELMTQDADRHAMSYAARLDAVIESLCGDMTTDTVNLVVGHLTVHGAAIAGSERAAHVFGYAIAAQAFPGHLSYVALGHFHRQQRVPAPAPVWYSGSPLQLDFGEAGEKKGVLVVEAEPGLPSKVEAHQLTSGKQLVRVKGTMEEVLAAAPGTDDAFVKVELDEAPRAGLAEELRERLPGVVDVTLLENRRDSGVDGPVPERLGRGPRELFAEYLSERGVEDERLISLFDELLEEVHEA